MRSHLKNVLLIVCVLWGALPVYAMGDRQAGADANHVSLSDLTIARGDIKIATYRVEIADSEDQRAQGLMFRQSLPADQAMLFVYERPRAVRMWMKNTYIPLDMIFADGRGVITHIHPGAQPHDLTPIRGGAAVRYVLEVNAGDVQAHGIRIGDKILHSSINN